MRNELAQDFVDQLELTDYEKQLLSLIWSTEKMTFSDLCNALRGVNLCPKGGDKMGWANLFKSLGNLRAEGYVDVPIDKGKMQSFQLTPLGADTVRDFADKARGLFDKLFTDSNKNMNKYPADNENYIDYEEDYSGRTYDRERFAPEGKPF